MGGVVVPMKLHGLFIRGLMLPGSDPRVFEPLAKSLPLSGYTLLEWNHDDHTIPFQPFQPLLIVGHSLGGERAYQISQSLGAVILCLLDPVRRSWSLSPFIKPDNVDLAICFNRDRPHGFELPPCVGFSDPKLNNYLNIPHSAFPTDPTVHVWLNEACKQMEAVA